MASGEIPMPLSPPIASPLSFNKMRPYLGLGVSFMNSVLQKEPGNGGDYSGQADQNTENLQKESPNPIGDIQSKNAENDQNCHRGIRQVARSNLVKNVRAGAVGRNRRRQMH